MTNHRPIVSVDAEYTICGIVESVSDTGRIYDRHETWKTDGYYHNGEDRRDIVDDWVEPVYKYTPVFLNGQAKGGFDTLDEAIEYAAGTATAESPLVGYLRVEIESGGTSFAKPGEDFRVI